MTSVCMCAREGVQFPFVELTSNLEMSVGGDGFEKLKAEWLSVLTAFLMTVSGQGL